MESSMVRNEAVLHLASQRNPDASQSLQSVELKNLSHKFDDYNLPAIDGELVSKYLEGAPSGAEDACPTPCLQDTDQAVASAAERHAIILNAFSLTYVNPPEAARGDPPSAAAVQSGDGWYSTLPNGPYAVASFRCQPQTKLSSENSPPAGNSEISASAASVSAAAPLRPASPFPPLWLFAIGRSLTFLDLSDSPYVDPAAWDLNTLLALPRLSVLCLNKAVVVSALPSGLAAALPSLRILDLCDALFKLPEEEVSAMLISLANVGSAAATAAVASNGAALRQSLVLTTAAKPSEGTDWIPASLKKEFPEERWRAEASLLRVMYSPPDADDGSRPAMTSSGRLILGVGNGGDGCLRPLMDPAAVRAVRAARERAFLAGARQAWWKVHVDKPGEEPADLVAEQPLDFSMIRLLYDLGLLPPLAEQTVSSLQPAATMASHNDNKDLGAAGGEGASKDEDAGAEFLIRQRAPPLARGEELTVDFTRLQLAWPYGSTRMDAPTWSHQQGLHSQPFRKEDWFVYPTSRQWRLLLEGDGATRSVGTWVPCDVGATGSSGNSDPDPFAVEVLAFQALEDRERLAGEILHAAGTGCFTLGTRVPTRSAFTRSRARPHPGALVSVATAAALAARTAARRLLVAGLLGGGAEVVSPAARGSVSPRGLLIAMRLECRLYGRVRRVSVLPRNHSAYASMHGDRYWASVRALHELLRTDSQVRQGVLTGAVPLAAAVEIPAAELQKLVQKMEKAAQKGVAGATRSGGTAALTERAVAAADASDLDALRNQVSMGGRLDEPVPVFVEDWLPSERRADSLCAWHISDPRVWPHGTVLHTAVALGHFRTAAWLLERGLPLNGRISSWELTPLHLCCMRPRAWLESKYFRFLRVPAATAPPPGDVGGRFQPRDYDFGDDSIVHTQARNRGGTFRHANGMPFAEKILDDGLGVPKGSYRRDNDLLFPGVCNKTVGDDVWGDFAYNTILGPLWFSVDDEARGAESSQRKSRMGQSPFMRALPCTEPAATMAVAHDNAAAKVSSSSLVAAASPMLRLLLSHGPDLTARSWSGLVPLHYAAATCGPETVMALLEAGASMAATLPGSRICPLHLLAHRSGHRHSGISARATAQLLACQPVIPAEEVLCRWDEWRGCPLAWLLADEFTCPAPEVLGALLASLRAELEAPGQGSHGRPLAGGAAAADGGGGGPGGRRFEEAVYGVARALSLAIVHERVEHVRMLLHHFPEAAGTHLPPANITPLHLACILPAWESCETFLHSSVQSALVSREDTRSNPPKEVLRNAPPYVPLSTAATADPSGSVSGSPDTNGRELQVLGSDSPRATGTPAGGPSTSLSSSAALQQQQGQRADDGGGEPIVSSAWDVFIYPLIHWCTKLRKGDSESAAMQRVFTVQLQVVQVLLGAGAPLEAEDACGCTPLVVAALTASPPVVAAMLEKGASLEPVVGRLSPGVERNTRLRLLRAHQFRDTRVLGLDFLLFEGLEAKAAAALQQEGEKKEDNKGGGDNSEGQSSEEEPEEDSGGVKVFRSGGPSCHFEPFVSALGDCFLGLPSRPANLFTPLCKETRLTPLTATVMRIMRYYTCNRHTDESGPGTGMRMDGQLSSFYFVPLSDVPSGARLSKFGDGILWLLLQHASPELRERVLAPLREATATNVVEEMPRTAIWLLREAMPGNHYVAYADRAAREACSTLSAFTISSLDTAIQKALSFVLKEADRVGMRPLKEIGLALGACEGAGEGGKDVCAGVPAWGPHEDEVLSDLVSTGLYPLLARDSPVKGTNAILRMGAQLLRFATCLSVCKKALLQAHIQQFSKGASTDIWAIDNIESLPQESYDIACGMSQQRVQSAGPQAASAAPGRAPAGGTSARAVGGGGDSTPSPVHVLHTLDDLEYGMMYARVAEVLPPVTSMRLSFGHGAALPHVVIRALGETMFKYVRTLCHLTQTELEWIRLPGGVTYTAVDGIYMPILPGDPNWNVSDMLRPRHVGFRLSFAYTRRTLNLELHAMTLMRTVPIHIEEPQQHPAGAWAAAADSTTASASAAVGGAGGGDGSGGSGALGTRRAGASPVTHSRAAEFGFWMRNPDVVRMEQLQGSSLKVLKMSRNARGNWRQYPITPTWWITAWADRFLRLFLVSAMNGETSKPNHLKLRILHDRDAQDPCISSSGGAKPWSSLEVNVMAAVLSLHDFERLHDNSELLDLTGRRLTDQDVNDIREVVQTSLCQAMISRGKKDSDMDQDVISFAAQWNKVAKTRNWPERSTLEIQHTVQRLLRMSGCAYTCSWLSSLQTLFGVLMSGETSPELRRETEAKVLSLASDSAFARRLVWGTCRGRRSEARALALLSGVVEFQPLLLEAIMEHEAECEALEQWSQEEQHWALAGGPALAAMEPEALSLLLQEKYDLDYRPPVLPYTSTATVLTSQRSNVGGAATLAASLDQGGDSATSRVSLAYCRFRSREDLARAVLSPLAVPAEAGSGAKSRGGAPTSSLLALLPVSLWEAGAVPSSLLPQRQDSVALPFFRLVFNRLPRGLQHADPHAAGTLWGGGLRAVLLHRRPAVHRWAPWGSPPDVFEEAGVLGALFDAHASEPLPKAWIKELDANEDGVVAYREFLLAYLRHRGGDFLGPQLAAKVALQHSVSKAAAALKDTEGTGPGDGKPAAAGPESAAATATGPSAGSLGWQRATMAVSQDQLSQAFWDQANALRRIRERDSEVMLAAQQGSEGPGNGDGTKKTSTGPGTIGGTGMAAVRQLGSKALGVLGGVLGGGGTASSLPLVSLVGLDCVTAEELSEVQRCAWIVYGNLRTAARYLQNAQSDGYAPVANGGGAPGWLTPWQRAERTALDSMMRGLRQPMAMFGKTAAESNGPAAGARYHHHQHQAEGAISFGPGGPRSWLQALSGAMTPTTGGAGGGLKGGSAAGAGRPQPRDSVLLELIVDLAAAVRGAARGEVLAEGDEQLVGPMVGHSPLISGRNLAAVAAQLGADAAAEVANAVGALALSISGEAASRVGVAPPVGGLDEVFCASAIRLAAEDVWAFVTDMQGMIDKFLYPLVAAADQNLPIIHRESIQKIFMDTNIEIIVEYEIELLKLLTVHWRVGARTGLVVPSVTGPDHYLMSSGHRKVAAARLRAFGGEFPPAAEQLGIDPLSASVQLRPLLTDPGVVDRILELLLRVATAYQNYLERIDVALQEFLACLERDEQGTLTALLRRFSRPVKARKEGAENLDGATDATSAGGPADTGSPDGAAAAGEKEDDSDDDKDGDGVVVAAATDGKGDVVNEMAGQPAGGLSTSCGNRGAGGDDGGGSVNQNGNDTDKEKPGKTKVGSKRLTHRAVHHVRPLLSVRQMARYGAGAEVEACLRKPAAHLASLALLATVCRSISAAQTQLGLAQARTDVGLGGEKVGPPGGDAAPPIPPSSRTAVGSKTATAGAAVKGGGFGFLFRLGKRADGVRGPARSSNVAAGARFAGGGVMGAVRRVWYLFHGVRVAKVLPLGADLHPLFKCPGPGPGGVPRSALTSTAEHRVALRGVGAAVLAERGVKGLGAPPTMVERLDVWMESRLLEGTFFSRLLIAVCFALACCTWRVVPLLLEQRRYREELRVANNVPYHRHVIRQLERAINIRPANDDALDAELKDFHQLIKEALDDAAKEADFGDGKAERLSPLDLESGFWIKHGPKRVYDPAPLKAALRLAEERTLSSHIAGARLLAKARRCAIRLTSNAEAKRGILWAGSKRAKDAKAGAAKGGRPATDAYDSDDDEAFLDAISAGPPGKKQPAQSASTATKEPSGAKGDAKGGMQLARLFGAKAAGERGGPKHAWGPMSSGGGGMAAAVAVMQQVQQFNGALKRAVRLRALARRRWDKTLFFIKESGVLDESVLAAEHAREVARLRRAAALMAWRHLRGAANDMLMVFGEVAFRDVGRFFGLAVAAFLMGFPFVLLGTAVQIRPDSRPARLLMGGLVACYVVLGYVAMVLAVAQLRNDPSQLKVYRPSDTIRFPNFRKGTALASWKAHWVNVFALVTLALEFWQLCAFSYQRRIPYPKESFLKRIFSWAILDLGPATYFLQVFALLAFIVAWIAVFFPQTPTGLKRIIMPFLGQAAYLTVTSGLLSQLDCRLDDGLLVRNPDIPCWTDPRHLYGAVAAMLALGLYVPRATLTPFEVFFPSDNLDIKYRGLYVRVVQLLRLGMAGYNLFFTDTYPLGVMLANAGVCALLAALTAIMRPCCISAVNIGRGTGFVLAMWSQVVSVIALKLSPNVHKDPATLQWYTSDWRYVYTLVAGWATIAALGMWLLRRHLLRLRREAIRFSLKNSPFNYTLKPAAATERAAMESAGTAANQQQQQPPPGAAGGVGSDGTAATPAAAAGEGGTNTTNAFWSSEDLARYADLGMPVMSISRLRELEKPTPAEEMRAFVSQLVRRAERRLAGDKSDSDDDMAPRFQRQ